MEKIVSMPNYFMPVRHIISFNSIVAHIAAFRKRLNNESLKSNNLREINLEKGKPSKFVRCKA